TVALQKLSKHFERVGQKLLFAAVMGERDLPIAGAEVQPGKEPQNVKACERVLATAQQSHRARMVGKAADNVDKGQRDLEVLTADRLDLRERVQDRLERGAHRDSPPGAWS